MSITLEEIPDGLSEHIHSWTKDSFEGAVEFIESWLDYALKKMYGKQKGLELKEKIQQRIRSGKITNDKINKYWKVIEDGDRDTRYLYPYLITLYFVAKAKAEDFHRKGLIAEAFSTTSLMSFCVGSLTENVETNIVGIPDYMEDPLRTKIANRAASATHAGSKIVQNIIANLILQESPDEGWPSKKAAATHVEKILIKQLYIPTPSSDGKEESYEPRPDLSFKLNLNATSLHERILKWMSAGKEGVGEINKAIQTTLRRKTNEH
ncbi:hypothetical protein [Ectopseudomonas alcaliphila]|uniref:Uncharacterized protein n=1 Tax=Ectopseudomonas alcaliphila TaxID=101564 RepID=A0A1G7G0A6_9GAMM|nr:hypothetical protein [Pseudomonas alcaliphila]MDX5994021.1 hypothetical protein [Pseudomonas alcaliphila]SDE81594.1 hypothetical protein SAMN05216575_10473 [Pseudomonas alcaliphila]